MLYYDPSGHAALGSAATALERSNPDLFEAHATAAELDLGLRGVVLVGRDYEDAVLAVAYAVRCIVERDSPMETTAKRVKSWSEGDQSRTFEYDDRAVKQGADMDPCALARRLAERLLAQFAPQGEGEYAVVRSLRLGP